jgi:hypothetical protein
MHPRVVASGVSITPISRVGDYRIMYEVLDDVLWTGSDIGARSADECPEMPRICPGTWLGFGRICPGKPEYARVRA